MQQAQQLRANGGIMTIPRQKYGFGSFVKKAFKKVAKPIKKIVKSPLGKAAIIGGLGMYGMGAGPFSGAKGAGFLKNLMGAQKAMGVDKFGNTIFKPRSGISGFASKYLNPFNKANPLLYTDGKFSGKKGWLAGGALAAALPFMMGGGEEEEEIVDTFEKTPGTITDIVAQAKARAPSLRFLPQNAYTQSGFFNAAGGGIARLVNGGGAGEQQMMQMLKAEYMKYRQNGGTMPFEQFAQLIMQQQQGQTQMAADGGRIGYNLGGPTEEAEVINEDTQEVVSNPDPMAELNALSLELFNKPYDQLNDREQEALQMFISQNPEEEVIDTDETIVEDRVQAADGGMMDYMSSANPMAKSYIMEDEDVVNMYRPGGPRQMAQEGGIMDLGGMEKDYRQEGGFVPIGGQEKADDVPARLSKNEFVFTADAVRAAGGGDIDQGAEVMQNVMDNLESGGQISEESQGGNPAQEMFDNAQQLESRIA